MKSEELLVDGQGGGQTEVQALSRGSVLMPEFLSGRGLGCRSPGTMGQGLGLKPNDRQSPLPKIQERRQVVEIMGGRSVYIHWGGSLCPSPGLRDPLVTQLPPWD